jgi:sodium/hydrogen antiporter
VDQLDVILLTVGALALALGLVSRLIRRVPLSEPLVAVALGVVIGPLGLGVVDLAAWGDERLLLEHGARVTLAIGLMAVALRLPVGELRASWLSIAVLVGLLMPLMWLATSAVSWLLVGLPLLMAVLLGAILTPTDPIVASTIVVGDFVERRVPLRLRRAISAESGFNDGLAVPFVLAPLVALGVAAPAATGLWPPLAIAWSVGGAVAVGLAIGYGAGRLLREADDRNTIEGPSFLAYTLGLTLLTLGVASVIGAEGILAVFVAGLAFDAAASNRERLAEERFQEAVNRFFILPIFILLGSALPWSEWAERGWRGLALAAGVLLLRRLPAMLAAGRLIPDLQHRHDTLFVGWFGPIGVAALYYGALASRALDSGELWSLATLVIAASILVHGLTADPFIRLYASAEMRRRATARR